ncbi:MAG: 50S ribosomal protein L5 [Candidatus Hydrogenedentes bacterium]|jgi:large subunit ribosomal protein L5|nr:50S ribosomal protein L5 [Candidatus Hydrogenedentota bacterium]
MARLKEKYRNEIRPRLMGQFGLKTVLAVPRVERIVVNMGLGDAHTDSKILDAGMAELAAITGQKPKVTRARKSISGFKLRAGMMIGCMVTLRGDRMYEFMDRLLNVVIPRIRDFRGVSPDSFDERGSFTLGIREQTIFPEVVYDKVLGPQGMNISFVIANSKTVEQSRELLRAFGMPFKR